MISGPRMSSIRRSSASSSAAPAAPAFSRTCSGRGGPVVGAGAFWVCSAPGPARRGDARAPARPAGALRAGPVLPGQRALADGGEDDLADALLRAQRDDLGLDDAPHHVVLRLVRDDPVEPHAVGDLQGGGVVLGPAPP